MSKLRLGVNIDHVWLFVGAAALKGSLAVAIAVAGVLVFAAAGWRVRQRRQRNRRFVRGYYLAAVVGEVVVLVLAQHWLASHGREVLLFPVVGMIVGAHFIGLWAAMRDRRFLWLTGAMLVVNLAALLIPMQTAKRQMLSGFGSSLALLAAAAS